MDCPACHHRRIPAIQTLPADGRKDGRDYRVRRCPACGTKSTSYEIGSTDLKNLILSSAMAAELKVKAGPTYDLERAMEKLLPKAIAAAERAVDGAKLDKVKADLIRWIVDDARRRRAPAAEAVTPPENAEDMSEMERILAEASLLPGEEAEA